MSEGLKHTRNVAIILAIAAAVDFVPGGGRVAGTVEAALWTAFGLAIGFVGLRLYREQHITLYSLGDRHRGLLYGAVALGFFLWAVRKRMWYALVLQRGQVERLEEVHRWGGFGEVLWFALAGLAVYALVAVYRHARAY
ncbi:MAG TPA: hypothetical protein VGY13_08950 [Solirubrobacteraceae bacterium]|jgi:hypothetical protein|nr:hypothetical protein [Solirubrobacteraceae bacterium]